MASTASSETEPSDGIFSLLDTDLYKLTMQCCILAYFPDVEVTYAFTNRTSHMKLNRASVTWLTEQIHKLANITLTGDETTFLTKTCEYFPKPYLEFLSAFRFRPDEQVQLSFTPDEDTGSGEDVGSVDVTIAGKWLETILYEIPILALISEAYFKFVDRDWTHEGQIERAQRKGEALLQSGCVFSEFGSRRRRDYRTHDMIIQGLKQATQTASEHKDWSGKLSGTSNVHLAMKHNLVPIGTVAHEFFMGVAAITNDYENANEAALRCWISTFGEGVLGIALTDTFGTANFVKAFNKPIPDSVVAKFAQASDATGFTTPRTYAQAFPGVRQDSGDPETFIQTMRGFYDSVGIKEKKTIVFSDALDVEKCKRYKKSAEAAGFLPSFGVGTFFTNDFTHKSTGKKSVPLNIVIKLSSAAGRPAIKISDNLGKNTGDQATIEDVKRRLGYSEKDWAGGDEAVRWGREGD